MGTGLILTHQPAETGYIGMQDGGELPLSRAGFEDFGHRPSDDEPNIGASAHHQRI
jgi:hypothetical protein